MIVVPAALGGLWIVAAFGLEPLPWRWRWILAAALGLGAMSIGVLIGGLLGVLDRRVWTALLVLSAAAGVVRLHQLGGAEREHTAISESSTIAPWRLLWLVVVPFATLALLAASNAPGFLWAEEGFGYDVLEYHLQLPREYLDQGQITYLPHNVYASFPAGVEMLYLLAMIVHGDPVECGTIAHMIHLFLGALVVAAAWAAGRDRSPRAGVVSGVAAASTGWLAYLSGLAYVENGMLFFGLCSVALLLQSIASSSLQEHASNPTHSNGMSKHLLLSGVLAGLACGCKYTAVVLIAFPIGLAWMMVSKSVRQGVLGGGTFALGAAVAFSPWLIKNQVMTGSPVFPLANEWFRASPPGWGEDNTRQWDRGHSLKLDERSFRSRASALWTHIVGDANQRFGPLLLGLGFLGLAARRRDRTDVALVVITLVQVLVWVFATHLYARFAVPLFIPLAILAGRSIVEGIGRIRGAIVIAAILGGAGWNVSFAIARHVRESPDAAPASLFYEGHVPGFEYLGAINGDLPADAKVLLVGDARPFYIFRPTVYCVAFNHNPFLEWVLGSLDGKSEMDRLRADGVTHILVHWEEVRRLVRTYGFSPPITVDQLESRMGDLVNAGITLERAISRPGLVSNERYVELYSVPSANQPTDE